MKKIFVAGKSQLAVLTAFFISGAMMATWVSRIPTIQNKLELNESGLGLVLLGLTLGVLTALSLIGGLIACYGSPKVVLVGAIVMAGTLPLLVLATNAIMLFVVLAVFGGALSAMDVAMNEQAVLVERKVNRRLMSSFHAVYSIGGLVGSLIAVGMAFLPDGSLLLHFVTAALLFGSTVGFIYKNLLPVTLEKRGKKVLFHFPERALWMLGAIAFCSSLVEGAMADWSGVYLTRVLHTTTAFAALGYAAFSLTMMIGRLMGDTLTNAFKPASIVRAGGFTAVLGFLTLVLAKHPAIGIIGFAVVGVGLSNIIPIIFGTAGNMPGIATGTGIAGVATIGYTASLAGPPMIGFIAEETSLRVAFLVIMFFIGTLVFTGKGVEQQAGN